MGGYLWEGIRAGLLLSLLVGPLVVLLIQLSLRRGTIASFAAATGIWSSDLLFITASHYGLEGLERIFDYPHFNEIVGTIGGFILLLGAAVMWFKRPPKITGPGIMPGRKTIFGAWLQGFAVNTFNPFTMFFWSTFVLTQVHERELLPNQSLAVYVGIMSIIVLSDGAKVLGARKLRNFLKPATMRRAQRVGAVALGVFGLVLALRVWL